jgi:hypothetical protein
MNTTEIKTAFTLENLSSVIKSISTGITIEDLKAAYYSAIANKDAIISEIDKKYTLADLKKRVIHHSGDKKASLVSGFYKGLLMNFKVTDGMISYNPYPGGLVGSGGAYNKNAFIEALTKTIEA